METYFERKIYNKMLEWKREYTPEYALFLKGARRTGKTTLAERMGKEEYRSYITVSFDKASNQTKNLFVDYLEDLDTFFNILQINYHTELYPRESLIILDEIQLYPYARQALKTLLSDGRYDYIETGSLAGIEKRAPEILIPSEEYELEVLPMDFEEFCWSLGDHLTVESIRSHYQNKKPFGSQLHHSIMKRFREYMCVGGMPQAIQAYIDSKNFGKVDFVKQRILRLYRSDMAEQQEQNSDHVINFFDRIPSELSKHDKRFNISHISPNARLRDYSGAVKWLDDARIINMNFRISEINTAFNFTADDTNFKCYLLDTGLLVSLAYRDTDYLDNELYGFILADKLQTNEGMLIENMIAQCLRANGHHAYYYRKLDEREKKTYEVDFVIRHKNKIILIESKSSDSTSIKSLKKAKTIYGKSIDELIVLHSGDFKRGKAENGDEGILYYPYYVASIL